MCYIYFVPSEWQIYILHKHGITIAHMLFSHTSLSLTVISFQDNDSLAPMITWKDFQRLMPWEIVILVGGGYALAAGCKVCVCVLVSVFCSSQSESACVFRCQACQCGSADSWSPWAVSLPGLSPCWPACWSRRSQSLRPTPRLLLSSCLSYQHWCDTHTNTQANIVSAVVNIWIYSLCPTFFCPVRVVAYQPPPYSDPVHHVCVIWGYAASGEPPQRHRLQLRPRADKGHGTTNVHTLFTCLKFLSVQ